MRQPDPDQPGEQVAVGDIAATPISRICLSSSTFRAMVIRCRGPREVRSPRRRRADMPGIISYRFKIPREDTRPFTSNIGVRLRLKQDNDHLLRRLHQRCTRCRPPRVRILGIRRAGQTHHSRRFTSIRDRIPYLGTSCTYTLESDSLVLDK